MTTAAELAIIIGIVCNLVGLLALGMHVARAFGRIEATVEGHEKRLDGLGKG